MKENRLLNSMQRLKEALQALRREHAENLLTNPNLDIDAVRYSQGYINALDYCVQTMDTEVASFLEESDSL
jgi:hypothetical protein